MAQIEIKEILNHKLIFQRHLLFFIRRLKKLNPKYIYLLHTHCVLYIGLATFNKYSNVIMEEIYLNTYIQLSRATNLANKLKNHLT